MSISKPTRSRGFGLRITSPKGEEWFYFDRLSSLIQHLGKSLNCASRRLAFRPFIGPLPDVEVSNCGTCLRWTRDTPYQAAHTKYGVILAVRREWKTYEIFSTSGKPVKVNCHLHAFYDLGNSSQRTFRVQRKVAHGVRGLGPVYGIHKSRGGSGYFRDVSTAAEMRLNSLVIFDDGELPVRAARHPKNLPNSWDDQFRQNQRNWKAQRKDRRQWERR